MDIENTLEKALLGLEKISNNQELNDLKVKYLGKKGEFSLMLKELANIPNEQKAETGKKINDAKNKVLGLVTRKQEEFEEAALKEKFEKDRIDITVPGEKFFIGGEHPVTKTIKEISKIFEDIGYSIVSGPEIETVANNFDALNAPKSHPARDMTDTFYIDIKKDQNGDITEDSLLLRTQTSPVQVRTLKSQKPPIKIIAPGRCFRTDTPDATHSPMFHQVEGLLVDEGVTFSDLKGTLDYFAKKMFGESVKTKFRPHYFPFTEPSCEMDMSCFACGGKGCPVCKGSGWIEILGCGMVHPNVLKVGDIDTEKYTGFAFGLGVERIAMLKHGISDIRLFYENDIRFLEEFI
jgi:phenylalanyl-tRNA synthetase alpha chain